MPRAAAAAPSSPLTPSLCAAARPATPAQFVGNQLALFNLIFLFTFGLAPITNLLALGRTFAPMSVPGARLLLSKLVYVALNIVGLLIVLWKVRAMGLLPLTSADWVSLLPKARSTHWGAAPEL